MKSRIKQLVVSHFRLPRIGAMLALLSIFGLGVLCYLGGAAVVYFQLPSSEYLENAFKGAKTLLDRAPVENKPPLSWQGVKNKVSVDVPEKTCDGFTLYTTSLATRAMLVDMRGNVVHKWHYPFSKLWMNPPHVRSPSPDTQTYWFGCHAFANGDLLAVYHVDGDTPYGYGLVKLDKNSNVVWSYAANVHHNVDVAEDGTIYALAQKIMTKAPKGLSFIPTPYVADYVVVLSPEGKELKSVPILDAFRGTPYERILDLILNKMILEEQIQARYIPESALPFGEKEPKHQNSTKGRLPDHVHIPVLGNAGTPADFASKGDYIHANSVKVLWPGLAGKFPLFKAGQVLVSLRSLDTLAVVDLEQHAVIWAARGLWRRQHAADFLPSGRLLLYDNIGSTAQTRVLEYEPATQAVPWSYANENSAPFVASVMGSTQRLPNGNTLIVDPEHFRIFEVSREKQLVWELYVGRPADNGYLGRSGTIPGQGVVTGMRRYEARELEFLKGQSHVRP